MFGRIGMPEIIIFLIIVLVIFGPKNLPRLARAMGQSARELKDGLMGVSEDMQEAINKPSRSESPKPVAPAGTVEQGNYRSVDPIDDERNA